SPSTPPPSIKSLPLTVKYGKTGKQIKAGRYDWVNDSISPTNFPTDQTGEIEKEALLVLFNRSMESDEAERELEALGLRPGNLDELLAVGKQHPDKQRSFLIVALGSAVRLVGGLFVPCLGGWGGGRELFLGGWGGGWDGVCRFLAFRK
ncbi:hypothetical protein KJ616_03435, partial [Patescibacteria group bacterium]|nr:hypothetical protein [Patescibacteria group bacterium]